MKYHKYSYFEPGIQGVLILNTYKACSLEINVSYIYMYVYTYTRIELPVPLQKELPEIFLNIFFLLRNSWGYKKVNHFFSTFIQIIAINFTRNLVFWENRIIGNFRKSTSNSGIEISSKIIWDPGMETLSDSNEEVSDGRCPIYKLIKDMQLCSQLFGRPCLGSLSCSPKKMIAQNANVLKRMKKI